MSTDDQPTTGSPAPFARRPVTWGRPPATVFRAGPLPKGGRLPPLPEPAPALTARADIFSGSMIPQAAPRPAPAPTTPPQPTSLAGAHERPVAARTSAAEPDLTVRPLPSVKPAADAGAEPIGDRAPGAAAVEPATPEPSAPAPVTSRRRAPLYAGVVAAVIGAVALGGWLLTRPATAPTDSVSAPTSPTGAAPSIAAPAVIEEAPAADPAPVSEAPPPPAPPAAERRAPVTPERSAAVPPPDPSRPSPSTSTPAATPESAPPVAAPVEPRIEIVPATPAGPPPTAAERPPSDPDAPIATRPQPLATAADQADLIVR